MFFGGHLGGKGLADLTVVGDAVDVLRGLADTYLNGGGATGAEVLELAQERGTLAARNAVIDAERVVALHVGHRRLDGQGLLRVEVLAGAHLAEDLLEVGLVVGGLVGANHIVV